MKNTNEIQPTPSTTLLTTVPSKRRLIFRWVETAIVVAALFALWVVFTPNMSWKLAGVVLVFLGVFAAAGITLSLIVRRNTSYTFTQTAIVVRAGVTEIITKQLPYGQITFYKKTTTIPDLLANRQTATFRFYKIQTKKNGKRVLVSEMVCSMWGVKKHEQISEILDSKNVPKLQNHKQLTALKKQLKMEWKQIKQKNKTKNK